MKTNPLDVKAKRMPRRPRIVLGGTMIYPALDDDYRPIKDTWAMPGRRTMSTDEVRALAKANDLMFFHSGDRE